MTIQVQSDVSISGLTLRAVAKLLKTDVLSKHFSVQSSYFSYFCNQRISHVRMHNILEVSIVFKVLPKRTSARSSALRSFLLSASFAFFLHSSIFFLHSSLSVIRDRKQYENQQAHKTGLSHFSRLTRVTFFLAVLFIFPVEIPPFTLESIFGSLGTLSTALQKVFRAYLNVRQREGVSYCLLCIGCDSLSSQSSHRMVQHYRQTFPLKIDHVHTLTDNLQPC